MWPAERGRRCRIAPAYYGFGPSARAAQQRFENEQHGAGLAEYIIWERLVPTVSASYSKHKCRLRPNFALVYDGGAYVPTAHRHAIPRTALKASARVWTAAMESAESPLSDAWGHPDGDLLATPRKAVTPLGSLRHRTPSRWP